MTKAFDLRRLALIGDSVFAVSITLNARAVAIPKLGTSALGDAAFEAFSQGVVAVLLSVVVACAFWLGHWRYFRQVTETSVALVITHFMFLLALILLPISTDLYATNHLNSLATLVYGLNLLFLAIVALVFRIVAIRHAKGRRVSRYDWVGIAGVIALFALAVALSFRSPQASQICWYIGLASPLVEAWLARRMRRSVALLDADVPG